MGQIHEAPDDDMYDVPDTEEALRRGEYTVIRSLIRVLEVRLFKVADLALLLKLFIYHMSPFCHFLFSQYFWHEILHREIF